MPGLNAYEGSFRCRRLCSRIFDTAVGRNRHEASCNYKCSNSDCIDVTFHFLETYQEHQQWHDTGKQFRCRIGCDDLWLSSDWAKTRHYFIQHGCTYRDISRLLETRSYSGDLFVPLLPPAEQEYYRKLFLEDDNAKSSYHRSLKTDEDRRDEAQAQVDRLSALKDVDPDAWTAQRERRTKKEVKRQAEVRKTWSTDDRKSMNDYKARLKREGRARESEAAKQARLKRRREYEAGRKPVQGKSKKIFKGGMENYDDESGIESEPSPASESEEEAQASEAEDNGTTALATAPKPLTTYDYSVRNKRKYDEAEYSEADSNVGVSDSALLPRRSSRAAAAEARKRSAALLKAQEGDL